MVEPSWAGTRLTADLYFVDIAREPVSEKFAIRCCDSLWRSALVRLMTEILDSWTFCQAVFRQFDLVCHGDVLNEKDVVLKTT